MASLLSSICCCFGSRQQPEEDDERTALLNPDIIPEAPARPVGRTTEEQLAEQEALRRILHEASERFVNIESPSPFTRPSATDHSPYHSNDASSISSFDSASSIPIYSPRTHKKQRSASMAAAEAERRAALTTPDRASTWRPPNDDTPVRVIHLGTNFEPHEKKTGVLARDRPMSAHSLKTLPRGGKGQPSPLGPNGGEDAKDGESEGADSRFQTMASYRTAHEGEGSEELGDESRRDGRQGDGKRPLGEVFSAEEGRAAEAKEDHEALAKALKRLVDSMTTFKLEPVGPIVADLSSASSSR